MLSGHDHRTFDRLCRNCAVDLEIGGLEMVSGEVELQREELTA